MGCIDLENKAIADHMDEILELSHRRHSLICLVYISLMIMSAITIWTFKHKRFQYFHETGLSVIYGLIVGIALRYGIKPSNPTFETCGLDSNTTSCGGRLPPEKVLVDLPMGSGRINLTLSYAFERAFEPSSTVSFGHIFTFNPEIFFNLLLPPIIFAAGYSMKRRHFFKNIGAILVYAFWGTLISALCVGIICYVLTRVTSLSSSLFFSDCLFFGSIVSATDPITVLAIFNDLSVDVDLYAIVFGESVLNDALAIALSQSVEQYGSMTSGNFDAGALFTAIGHFVAMFSGSFGIGIGVGIITALVTKFTHIREHPLLESALFVLMSYSTYLLAETVGFTGIVAVLFCGITQAHYTFNNLSEGSKVFTKQVFELMNFLSEIFLFVYLGVLTFAFQHHYWHAGFILIALFACVVARALSVYPLSALINLCRGHRLGCSPICFCCPSRQANGTEPDARAATTTTGDYQVFENATSQSESLDQADCQPTCSSRSNCITWNMQHMLMFSGLRGAMAFSLAIRNTSSETRQMFFSTTIAIVMITVLLCGGLVTSMLKWLKIPVGNSTTEGTAATSHRDVIRDKPDCGFFNRHWSRLDKYYLKPLLTHSKPPPTESLPWCCFGLAKLLTSEEQRLGSIEDSMDSTGNNEGVRREARKSLAFEPHYARYFPSGDPNSKTDMTHKLQLSSETLYDTTHNEPGSTPLPTILPSYATNAHQQQQVDEALRKL